MLIPRFSLRRLLVFTALCAPACLVLRAAWIGDAWARSVIVGAAFIALTLCVHAAFFALMWPLSMIARALMSRSQGTRHPLPVRAAIPDGRIAPTEYTASEGRAAPEGRIDDTNC